MRTRQGKEDPIGGDEVRRLVEQLDGARVEPCSLKDGELDLVLSRDNGLEYRFVLQRGELWTSNPEDGEIRAMLDIAERLRVRGDELETFRTPTETYFHPDDRSALAAAEESVKRLKQAVRRRQWTLNLGLILFFATLASLAMYFSKP